MPLLGSTRIKLHGIGLDLAHPLAIPGNQGIVLGKRSIQFAVSLLISGYHPQTTHKVTLGPATFTIK